MSVKVTESKVKKLLIQRKYDTIHVYVEDYGQGAGSITIRCHTRVWSAGWGSMGEDILSFFAGCDEHYLLKNLCNHADRTETDIAGTIANIRKRILDKRRSNEIDAQEAEELWWEASRLDDSMQEWELFSVMTDMPQWLMEDAVRNKLSSDAEWLRDTIIPTIWEAITELKAAGNAEVKPS